ncbi:MAG: peptidase U32 family protein [Flavisolibacter sp.]
MRKPLYKPELLSPAGSFDSLHAAIAAGADAVYFGVEQLNMRARSAAPFTVDDLPQIATICHQKKVKCYITLNTVMYDHDRQLLQHILREVKRHGIDAVIASDFAVLQACREMGIPLHISTQANISNFASVQFFAPFADVVVLARELTLSQVKAIVTEIGRQNLCGPSGQLVKLEVFVHGALCMAISGKCYLSLHSQQASANRGACVQNCRRAYEVTDVETGEQLRIENEYIMSPKDLCTIGVLDQVVQTGVGVLKIEGRTKGAEYVHTVTGCYREAIDAITEGSYTPDKIKAWEAELAKVYNRGFWEGYYLGRKLGEWTERPGSAATQKKVYLGKGVRYFPKLQVAEFVVETGSIVAGDEILVSSPAFGVEEMVLQTLTVNGNAHTKAAKGDSLTFPFPHKISAKDKLYKLVPQHEGDPLPG